jgi:hypothetical protein
MRSYSSRYLSLIVALLVPLTVQAEDLHIKKSVLVGGNFVSTTETSIKGARERNVNGNTVTIRQCDLNRTLTVNDQAQTYFVTNDPQDDAAARAAALVTGAAPADNGGQILVTTTITDTGERKPMYGYTARHLKATVVEESSKNACSQVSQKYEIDGWYADLSKEQTGCAHFVPPVQQGQGCNDRVVARRIGSGKPGYPLRESITMHNADTTATTVTVQVSELTKQQDLPTELFDIPAQYRQVNSAAELNGGPQAPQQAAGYAQPQQPSAGNSGRSSADPYGNKALMDQAQHAATPWGKESAGQQAALNQAAALGLTGVNPMGPNMGGMPGMGGGNQPASTTVAAPQALGPKASGRIRIGVAPPDAQLGQGNNAGADYSTPIRNAEVALMSGPAVEIAALDSHIAMQLQAEAQQKQCDYILYSSVAVKHSSGGGFGKFMKMAAPVASMVPMAGMGGGVGGAMAAQTAGMAASVAAQAAQQQAINQLSGFNGQIKSKDDVTVQYQLVPTGQTSPVAQNTLKGKAKSDGEDVLSPLLQQAAASVLTEVSKK